MTSAWSMLTDCEIGCLLTRKGRLTQWLDLSFNNISKIEGLESLLKLTDLSLFNNRYLSAVSDKSQRQCTDSNRDCLKQEAV